LFGLEKFNGGNSLFDNFLCSLISGGIDFINHEVNICLMSGSGNTSSFCSSLCFFESGKGGVGKFLLNFGLSVISSKDC